jgi:non-ribosomal peptide synthetase component F
MVGPLLALSLLAASQLPYGPTGRIAVTVTSAARERTARSLSSAVLKELRRDPRFALIDHPAPVAVTIAMPAGIGWERRLDWTEISYQARLTTAAGQTRVVAGHCYNWNLGVCAKHIADAAAELGRS